MEDYTIPRPEPTPSPLFAAALALGKEAHRRGQEAILPAFYEPFAVHAAAEKISEESPAAGIMPQSAAPSRYLLTEGIIQGLFIHVAMPSGATWRYSTASRSARAASYSALSTR